VEDQQVHTTSNDTCFGCATPAWSAQGFYQVEVEMLRPGTILPGPQTVSRDIKSIYAEMSKNVRNYFMVTYISMQLLLY
jgi:hypothetical protein